VLLNPSASHFAFAKQQIRERFVLEGSRAFQVSYAYANLLGNEAGRSIYDGGTLIASGGKMLARGPRFSFADWLLTTAVVDIDNTRRAKAESFLDTNPRPAAAGETGLVVADDQEYRPVEDRPVLDLPGTTTFQSSAGSLEGAVSVPGHLDWETGTHQKEEEFTRSVALALFDYLRKSRSQGFVVSLSGGADSSAVAVFIYLLVQLAARELGFDTLRAKLAHIRGLKDLIWSNKPIAPHDPKFGDETTQFVRSLLTCVYQATRNSGSQTFEAAKSIAKAVGAEFLHWNVDAMVDEYVRTVAAAAGRELTWGNDDLALQNVQARARGPGVWLLANLRDALLLTTSNRSEAAVGYATMDGDTCGGLAPIAGIDKAFLLEWLKWMETIGPADIGPLQALSVVNNLKPTAELRPPSADQTDEADLMPYRFLDAVERAAIRDKLLPVEVFQAVRPQFPPYDAEKIGVWIERFFRLWCRNQWKRERYAPSFHLDDENLDPKTWCRFPILNSGFDKELGELREYVRNHAKE
jgi:NAD+ synthase (glutamine-hydrolysing)